MTKKIITTNLLFMYCVKYSGYLIRGKGFHCDDIKQINSVFEEKAQEKFIKKYCYIETKQFINTLIFSVHTRTTENYFKMKKSNVAI